MLYEETLLKQLEMGLRSALPNWGLPPHANVNLINISENATYCVLDEANKRKLILRVHRPGYHTRAEIISELAWIEALRADRVLDTPAPVAAIDGSLVCAFEHNGQQRDVVAFEDMCGREPDTADDLVFWFERLGMISANLHLHSRKWNRPEGFVRKSWTYETILGQAPHWGSWRDGLGLDPNGTKILEQTESILGKQIDAYGMGHDRFGLIHADLRLANLLVDGENLSVIDFDDCGLSWFCFDFAAAVTFLEHEPFLPSLKSAWITGYRCVAPLSIEDEEAIDMFVMLRRIQVVAWIASHSETPTAQQMGVPYTQGTITLAKAYLSNTG